LETDEDEADEDEVAGVAENGAAGELGEERADPRSGLFSAIVAFSARWITDTGVPSLRPAQLPAWLPHRTCRYPLSDHKRKSR
jgi:hypothetical protein